MNCTKTLQSIKLHFRQSHEDGVRDGYFILPTTIEYDYKTWIKLDQKIVISSNGTKIWYIYEDDDTFNFIRHRPSTEGPAVIRADGVMEYFENGMLHRPSTEGPAVIFPNGNLLYFENGMLHRSSTEGPAVICICGDGEGGDFDSGINNSEYHQYYDEHRFDECYHNFIVTHWNSGDRLYYFNGEHHRPSSEGPAVICTDGDQFYYENNNLHRPSADGPAVIYNGIMLYYVNGHLHRPSADGPAVISSDGSYVYFDNDDIHRSSLEGPAIFSPCNSNHSYFIMERYFDDRHIEDLLDKTRFRKELFTMEFRIAIMNKNTIDWNQEYKFYYNHNIIHRQSNEGPAITVGDIHLYIENGDLTSLGDDVQTNNS
ncbi:MAG: hypothetical protein JKX76_02645 [Colwellia sp.]|nr:hypothetical protein [Colwellia sp.]